MRIIINAVLMLLLFTGVAVAEHQDRAKILERIKPVGTVKVSGQAEVQTKKVEAKPAVMVKTGESIYKKYCFACHAAGVAGAPKFRDAGTWKPRLAKGMKSLLHHAVKGLNAMPAKGTCMDCNDKDIEKAIKYMLPK